MKKIQKAQQAYEAALTKQKGAEFDTVQAGAKLLRIIAKDMPQIGSVWSRNEDGQLWVVSRVAFRGNSQDLLEIEGTSDAFAHFEVRIIRYQNSKAYSTGAFLAQFTEVTV